MELILLIIIATYVITFVKFRSFGLWPFIPMVVCTIFLVAMSINILNSMTYLDSHPQLGGNQVGWFKGYWPLPFLIALIVIIGMPVYLGVKNRRKSLKHAATK